MKKDYFRIYGRTVEPGRTVDGGILERSHGCNGKKHADSLHVVYYNRSGKVIFAKSLSIIVMGDCDDHACCGEGFFS